MKYARDNPITYLLLGSCLVLTTILGTEWLIPYNFDAMQAGGPLETVENEFPTGAQQRYVHPHIDDFPEVLSRPIFFSKRQLPPKAATTAPAPRTPLRLKLEGVAIATNTRVAILRDLGNNQLLQFSLGMSHNDWLLEELTAKSATFRRDDEVVELTLEPVSR